MSDEPNILRNIHIRREVVNILRNNEITPPESADLAITERSVCERSGSRTMSDQILEATFPKTGATDALHFTLPSVLPSILQNRQLWLAPVAKNIGEGEYDEFARENGFASAEMDGIKHELAQCFEAMPFHILQRTNSLNYPQLK
jgi:hypothetical protein